MKNSSGRVVITGIGVVSPIGIGKDAFWQGLREGRSGIKPVTLFDTSTTQSKLAGEILDFRPEDILGEKGLRNLDRTTRFALCAAKMALDDAHLLIDKSNADDVGVVLGSTMGSVWSTSEFDKQALREGPRSVNPGLFANTVTNSPASNISIRFAITGFNTTISSGFSSSLDAIEYAANQIKYGRTRAVLVGGAEELCEQLYKAFYKLGVLSGSMGGGKEVSCPFDARRNGMILGEGSAFFVLEDSNYAVQRGARVYGIVDGYGSQYDRRTVNRYDMRSQSARASMVEALNASGMRPQDVKCIVSSANSTILGDIVETKAITDIFGDHLKDMLVPACKSMTGEAFSASGAIGIAEALFVLSESFIPPTINFMMNDDRCALECVPNIGRKTKVSSVLVNSFGMTGKNASLVLRNGE